MGTFREFPWTDIRESALNEKITGKNMREI